MTNLLQRLTTQRKLVADLEEPKRVLHELEAEYAAQEAERERKRERLKQAEAELSDHERDIARIGPKEANRKVMIEGLDELADDAMHGLSRHLDPYLMGRAAAQCRAELELLANARTAQKRLVPEIRALERDLGVK